MKEHLLTWQFLGLGQVGGIVAPPLLPLPSRCHWCRHCHSWQPFLGWPFFPFPRDRLPQKRLPGMAVAAPMAPMAYPRGPDPGQGPEVADSWSVECKPIWHFLSVGLQLPLHLQLDWAEVVVQYIWESSVKGIFANIVFFIEFWVALH